MFTLYSELFLFKIQCTSLVVVMHRQVVSLVLFTSMMLKLIFGELVIQWKLQGIERSILEFCDLLCTIFSLFSNRINFSVSIADSKIYVLGGEGLKGAIIQTVEAYDPTIDRWKEIGLLPKPRRSHATCTIRGKIWSCGGISSLLEAQSTNELVLVNEWFQFYSLKPMLSFLF